jgi:F-type H+-transporting ATPase subunit alpha
MSVERQVLILYVAVNGYLDDVALDKVAFFETKFHDFMATRHPEIVKSIVETKEIGVKTEEALKKAILEFKELRYPELFRYVMD